MNIGRISLGQRVQSSDVAFYMKRMSMAKRRNIIRFAFALFEDLCRGQNIFLSRFPSNLNGLDNQLVENFVSTLVSKSVCAIANIYVLGTQPYPPNRKRMQRRFVCYLFPRWNPETPKTHHNRQPDRYFRRTGRPQKRFKVEATSKFMNQQLSPGGSGKI
ncbi:hypothetical protein ACTXT7_014534 [Hymenolepis weldensis]